MKNRISRNDYLERFYRLSGIKQKKKEYLIMFTIEMSNLITEHETLSRFNNSTNLYLYHPEKTNPPVRAHYHIYPSNGRNEIYAVNTDGTAHHKSNRGFVVPRKEAEELKALGVRLNDSRILEYIEFLNTDQQQLITESLNQSNDIIYLKFEE